MNKQISEIVKLAVEITFGAAFLALIVMFAYVSNTGFRAYATNKADVSVMEEAKVMNEYNNVVVSGVDVVDIIVTMPWDNRFIIEIASSSDKYVFPSVFDLAPDDVYNRVRNSLLDEGYRADDILGTKKRTKEEMTALLGTNITGSYKSTLLYKGGSIIGIKFTKE